MQKLTVTECCKRRSESTFIVMYAIRNEVNIKKGDYIENEQIYTFVGIDIKGVRQFINIYPDRPNNNRYWLDCFEAMKSKGIKTVLFLSVNDNKNMKRAAKIAFPNITFVDSITDIVPKFYKYSSERNSRDLSSKIHKLYVQKTNADLKNVLTSFKATYNNIIHQKLIEKYFGNIESIYKYSVNIRIMLFKYTANMQLYDKIRLSFNHHNSYITDMTEIYDKLGNVENYFGFTSYTKKEWTLMLNDLMQLYPEIDFI